MKKQFLILLMVVMMITSSTVFVYAASIVNSYTDSDTGYLNMRSLHPSASAYDSAVSQSFNASKTFNIQNVTFRLAANGAPVTGNMVAVLYAHSGVYGTSSVPTGSPLATSDPFDMSILGAVSTNYNFTFTGSNQYRCNEGTVYCIVLQNPSTGSVDASHYPVPRIDTTAPTATGNFAHYANGSWVAVAGTDMYYIIYEVVFWGPVAEVIDEAFNLFGIVGFMQQINDFVSMVSGQFTDSLLGLATLINLQFQVIWNTVGFFTNWATRIIDRAIDLGERMRDIMNGVALGSEDVWAFFEFDTWAPDVVPLAAILYWIDSIYKRGPTQGYTTVLWGDLQNMANVFAFFIGAFSMVIGFIEDKVNWVIQALP